MAVDLVITNGTLTTTKGTQQIDVAVDEGKIVAIALNEALPPGREQIDARGLHVLPGLVDPHVHVRDPGRTDREDFYTATAAAAAGGVTTFLEMPIATPPLNSAAALDHRVNVAQDKALIDYAFYGGAAADNLDEIEAIAEAGAVAFKTFRTAAPAGREREFVGLACPDAGDYLQALTRVARTGLISAVHAEEEQLVQSLARQANGAGGPASYGHQRPEIVEIASVAQCLTLAQATGARIHFVHCSSPRSLALIREARASGLDATAETCPQYLFLSEEDLANHGPFAKSNPPLRNLETVEKLWECVRQGDVNVIGTDHSPFLYEEKKPFWNDMAKAMPGFPGLESLLPQMLTAVNQGKISMEQMIALTSENPAKLFGLYPQKGAIRIGSDADLVLVDLQHKGQINTQEWHSKARAIAQVWDGRPVQGKVVATLVRGRIIAKENDIVGERGWGKFVRPLR